jgi:hypothetical protein
MEDNEQRMSKGGLSVGTLSAPQGESGMVREFRFAAEFVGLLKAVETRAFTAINSNTVAIRGDKPASNFIEI